MHEIKEPKLPIVKKNDECKKMQQRIENGDIFHNGISKGKCSKCQAVTNAELDKYCWKCGSKLNPLA